MGIARFGPQRKAIWRQVCKEIDAEFIPNRGFRGSHQIIAKHENWTIVIDTYKRGKRPRVTQIRAPYVNRDGFEFRIYRRKAFSNLNKALGMQDIEVGFKQFDDDFIIQGNDVQKLRALFDNNWIRRFISWQPQIMLWNEVDEEHYNNPFQEGMSELRFETEGIISHVQQLKDLYDLFAELLDHLCHIGSAYDDDPLRK
ncbi:MAG: DUF3137 domain-containing protein [Bacteroidota bacterium]